MSKAAPHIALVAGEASGDMLAGGLIQAIRSRLPHAQFLGIAGPAMRAAGCETWYPQERLAVRGYIEVIKHLPALWQIRRSLLKRLLQSPPDLFIGVDAPDFNLGVEAKLKARNIKCIHYVSPSIWAWRKDRLSLMRRAVDRVLTLFPFEKNIYDEAQIAATYVGHPIADLAPLQPDKKNERAQLKLSPTEPVFAWLPGSRLSELELHSEMFIETARLVHQQLPKAHFLVPLVNRQTREYYASALYRLKAEHLPMTLLYGHAENALAAADVGLIASGTASLEAALYRCPHVVTYRLSRLTYWWVRSKVKIAYAALPNILQNRFVVPELLQEHATAENLAQAVLNLYQDKTVRNRMNAQFEEIHHRLRCGSSERAAQAVLHELGLSPL